MAAALGLAQLSYSFIEEPFIPWGTRLEARWPRTVPLPLAAAAAELVPVPAGGN
ncbi:MAG: hypothetical protein JO128_17195 [Alphaproteobacteria bacterium]|nr:hypothetical protein [Alphaproteobacteria bacterium]